MEWLAWLTLLALAFQLGWQWILWLGLRRLDRSNLADKQEPSTDWPALSVVVAVKNEERYLPALLEAISNQQYPNFEVVLVDDGSSDRTLHLLQQHSASDPRFRVIEEADSSPLKEKKAALDRGIQASKFPYLVFTDGDSIPFDESWLKRFGRAFQHAEVVIGTGLYVPASGWWSQLYAAESCRVAMMTHAWAALGRPYMAVGRSMGYSKQAYQRSKGFIPHAHIASGSDDLLVQELARQSTVQSVPAALTLSHPPSSLWNWCVQKKRHLEAGRYYPPTWSLVLMINDLTLILLPLLCGLSWWISREAGLLFAAMFVIDLLWLGINMQKIINLSGRPTECVHLWWLGYPASCLNALISVASLWVSTTRWTTNR